MLFCSVVGLRLFFFTAVYDAAAGQIVRGQLDAHFVSRQNPDVVHPHFSRDMGQDDVAALDLNAEHCVRKRFQDFSFHFYFFFFSHLYLVLKFRSHFQ